MFNIFKKKNSNNDFKKLSNQFHKKETEILVLLDDSSGAAGKNTDTWTATQYFLAYIDLNTNSLIKEKGRLNWLLTDEELKNNSSNYPYHFKKDTIYHLRVRKFDENQVKEGFSPSFFNKFLVLKVIKADIKNDELLEVLADYKKPISISNEKLGKFKLDKQFACFEGKINWLKKETLANLEVDVENEQTWDNALNHLNTLIENQEEYDITFREFSAKKLLDLANDWRLEEESEITQEVFKQRMKLSNLVVEPDGSYTAYYNTIDEMFSDHAILVSGNIKTGIKNADIG